MYGGGGLLLGGVGGGNAAKTKSVVLTSNRRKGKVTEYLLLEQAYVAELKKCIDSYVQPLRAQWEQFVQVLGDHHRYIAAEGGYEVEEEDQNAATDTIANAFRSGFEELEAMHSLHLDLLTRIKEVAAPPPPPPAMSPRRELAASSEDAGSASSPRSQFPPPPPSGPPPSASSSGPALPPGPPSRLPPYIRTIHIVQEKSPELLSLYRSYQSNYFTFASTIRELKHNTAFSELLVRSEEETQQPTPPPPQEDTEQVVPETQPQNEEENEGPKAEQEQEGQQEAAKEESAAEVPPPLPPRRSPSQAALALMGVMENAFHRPLECFERYPILLLDLIELKNEVRGHSSTSPLVQLSALSASKGRRKRRGTTGNETTEEEEEEATEKEDRPLFRLVRAMRRLLKEMRRTEGIDVSDDDDSDSDSDSETETETETETEKEEEGVEQQYPRTVGEAEAGEGEVDSTSDHDHQASEEASVPTSPHEHQHSVSALPATDAQQVTNGEGEHQTVGPVTPPNRRLSRLAEPDDSVLGGGSSGGSSDEEGSGGSGIFSASGKQRTRRGSLLSMSHKKERKEKKERKKEEKKERKEKKKTEKKEKKERRKSIGKSQNSGKLLTRALSTNTLPSNTETYKQGAARFDQTRTLGRSDSVGPSMLMRSLHNSSNNKEPTSPEGTAVRRKSILPPHLQEPNEQQEQHEQHEHEETATAEEEEDGNNKPEEEPLPSEAQNDEEHQQQQPIDESECKTPEQPKKMTPFEWRTTIANEILTTERTYVAQLTRLLTEYISPLRRLSEMTGGKSIKMEELNKIFSNVELILNVNKELLAGLEERIGNNWNETAVFGDVFLDMAPFLKLYSQYSKDHEDANKTLIACQEKYPEFKQFLERKMGQDISAFLILPIQRIPRYLLLLKDLIRRTDPSHSDYDKLQAAYEKVKEVADFINENIRKAEAMNKIIEIEKKLEGNPESLVIPSRRYVREGAFQEISNKGLRNCYLFLFNDMLLLATPQRSRYKFKTTVSLHGAQVIPAKVGFANAFGIVNGLIKHEFSAPDSNTQSMWVSDLESMADQLHKIELTKKDHQLGAELVFNMMPSSPTSAEKANRKKGSGLFGRKKKSGK